MTEAEAIQWLLDADVPRETIDQLAVFTTLVADEAQRQNLIAASTLSAMWSRHVVDSAQLVPMITPSGPVLDIGTGAGFPGLVVALISGRSTILAEPRARRAAFLAQVVAALDLTRSVSVLQSRVEGLSGDFATIMARAVASLDAIFAMSIHLADETTRWILPRGKSACAEVEAVRETWQGCFELVPSVSDPESSIVIASQIERRQTRPSRPPAAKSR